MKIIYLLLALSLASCKSQEKATTNFDLGTTKNGEYNNKYFGISLIFDPAWKVQDKKQMENLIDVGARVTAGDDKNLKAVLDASVVNTAYLLSVFKYDIGTAVENNPSFMLIAENNKNTPGIKNGGDYLYHNKKILEQSQMDVSIEKEIYTQQIDSTEFYVMETKMIMLGRVFHQRYYATLKNGFNLSLVYTFTSPEGQAELKKVLNSIRIQ